jgi:hypothetical protein
MKLPERASIVGHVRVICGRLRKLAGHLAWRRHSWYRKQAL